MKFRRIVSLFLTFAILLSTFNILKVQATAINADTVGFTHVGGLYSFQPTQDFLNEGADQISALGSRVIKLWFVVGQQQNSYTFNSNWPAVANLTALAQTTYFSTVFSKPFTTYILEAFESLQYPLEIWPDGMTLAQKAAITNEFYLLTKHLMNTYQNTGKTFILQNWEGDNSLGNNISHPNRIQGMIDWLNARQDGITQARQELSTITGVKVYGAAEVNFVTDARTGTGTTGVATNQVIPYTHMDLYSYSMYDVGFPANAATITANLDYLKAKAPDSTTFGADNIYIGEYGIPENEYSATLQVTHSQTVVQTALGWGVKYVAYWQLYCNEQRRPYTGRPTNADLRGFWLIRPDGTKPPVYDYFKSLFPGVNSGATYKVIDSNSGRALSVVASGTANGSGLNIWDYAMYPAQKWVLTNVGGSNYKMIDTNSGRALSVMYQATANGTGLHIWDYAAVPAQIWTITNLGSNNYKIIDSNSGRALSVMYQATANGTGLHIWDYAAVPAQIWQLDAP